jgi:hypothetical protein
MNSTHDEWLLDEALQETFPASDPIAPASDAGSRPRPQEKDLSMPRPGSSKAATLHERRKVPLATPTDLKSEATRDIPRR